MTILTLLGERLDALLHPSARGDALVRARHRAFIAPRLFGSLAILAIFPVYLAFHGAPGALEVGAFAWLTAPILLSWFLSRTGRYEAAHQLSSIALGLFVLMAAVASGGIGSAILVWLAIIPMEAALSTSRRVLGVAVGVALYCLCALSLLDRFGVVPGQDAGSAWTAFCLAAAIIYAAGIAWTAQTLTETGAILRNDEEDRYRLLARNMSDVISRHRSNGAVAFVSPAAETLVGVAPSRLLGHALFDRVHVADRPAYLTAMSDAARGSEERSVEFRLRREGRIGTEFIWIEMRCRPLETAEGTVEVVAVLRDITERKEQERALDQARSIAAQADASRSRFLATMSHELRTPLNAIIGFSEIIAQEDTLMIDAARRKEYAELIHDSGRHLLSVVNSILDMSKIESGKFEISPEPFAPRPALIGCCNLLALKARDGGVDLVTRAPESLPDVTGDLRAFKQIVLNLVSNAIKFTERGGVVTVSAHVEGSRLVLRVADTGVGIAADDLKRIGDPFFQAGTTYQRRHEGTGLGVSIVKSLVALHGGDMSVQSQVGEGTTVTVSLPLQFTGAAQPAAATVTTLVPPARAGSTHTNSQVKKSA